MCGAYGASSSTNGSSAARGLQHREKTVFKTK
jgi:hypothetical protein